MTKPLAVITGASSGIGEATAKAFSNAGYPTLLLARRIEIMESFNLKNSICKKIDVRDRDALVSAIREAEKLQRGFALNDLAKTDGTEGAAAAAVPVNTQVNDNSSKQNVTNFTSHTSQVEDPRVNALAAGMSRF